LRGVIWYLDLIFDLDDTLIETIHNYHNILNEFFTLLQNYGFDYSESSNTFCSLERLRIKSSGFSKDVFPLALVDTYDTLSTKYGKDINYSFRKHIENLGRSVYDLDYPEIPGVSDILSYLKNNGHRLLLFTKGDIDIQFNKIRKASLESFFDIIEVFKDKTLEDFSVFIKKHDLNPEDCIIIGDSVRSDVNPGLLCGMQVIHVGRDLVWDFEVEEIINSCNYNYTHSIKEVPDIVEKIVNKKL